MPSNRSILTWKYCHKIFLDYSFAALQWHPPWTSPHLPQWATAVESSIRGGSRALQKPRAYHWEDCRTGKTLVSELPSPWDTYCFPFLEKSKSLVTWSRTAAPVCCWPRYHQPSWVTSALLSWLFHTTHIHRDVKPSGSLRPPEAALCYFYPRKIMEQLQKVNSLISNH